MFDIGASELLVIVIVAVLVIGPKDLPLALRTAGRWIGKVRRVSAHFRTGIDAMIREAELDEMEKHWQEQNARIMRETPDSAVVSQALPIGGEGKPLHSAPIVAGTKAEAGPGNADPGDAAQPRQGEV